MDFSKICADCAHSYFLPDKPRNRRCHKSEGKDADDVSLCAMMRRGDVCGPTAILWEKRNG